MRVKCVQVGLTKEQRQHLGTVFHEDQDFHVTPGKEYVAIGLNFSVESNVHGTGVWVHLVTDYGNLGWAPLALFEIIDPRVSRYWVARRVEGGVTLWPESLHREFYHDDLSEGVAEIVSDFERVRALIEAEAATGM
jgi:hypothetical protein